MFCLATEPSSGIEWQDQHVIYESFSSTCALNAQQSFLVTGVVSDQWCGICGHSTAGFHPAYTLIIQWFYKSPRECSRCQDNIIINASCKECIFYETILEERMPIGREQGLSMVGWCFPSKSWRKSTSLTMQAEGRRNVVNHTASWGHKMQFTLIVNSELPEQS